MIKLVIIGVLTIPAIWVNTFLLTALLQGVGTNGVEIGGSECSSGAAAVVRH